MNLELKHLEARSLIALAGLASSDTTRPVLTGIHLEWEGQQWAAVATDSYVLGVMKWVQPKRQNRNGSVLVPAKSLANALKGAHAALEEDGHRLQGDRAVTSISTTSDKQLSVRGIFDPKTVYYRSFRVVHGKFPDWRGLIPGDTRTNDERTYNPYYLHRVAMFLAGASTLGELKSAKASMVMEISTADNGPTMFRAKSKSSPDPIERLALIMPVSLKE